jgi:hypothetical protein
MVNFNDVIPATTLQSRAGSGFEQLGWHNIGWDLHNWVVSLVGPIVVLLVAFVIIIIVSRWHTKVTTGERNKRNIAGRLSAAIQRCKLSGEDLACVNLLSGFSPGAEPIAIIEQHELFERCVHAAMSAAARRSSIESDETARTIAVLRKKIGLAIYPVDKQLTSTRAIGITQVCSVFGPASNKEPIIKSATVSSVTEQSIHLRFKRDEAHPPELAPGALVRIAFSRANDGYYGAQVPVIAGPTKDSIELGHSIEIKRSQLRKFVRVSASTRIKCRMIKPATPQTPSLPTGEMIEADMHDLSGGGLSFTYAKSLHSGDLVSLGFHLGNARIAGLKAAILRISERTVKGQQVFLHNCKFNPIDAGDQEKIVKFTFEQMRMLSTWNMKRFN